MCEMITIKKQDFLNRFETGFVIVRSDFGLYNYNLRRTSIEEIFLDVEPKESNERLSYCKRRQNQTKNYSKDINEIKAQADEIYFEKLYLAENEFDEEMKHFSIFKKISQLMNLGYKKEFEIFKNDLKNIKIIRKILDNQEPLPAKIIYLIPEEFEFPAFIPEINQKLFQGYFNDYNDFGVIEYEVIKISFSSNYFIRTFSETENIGKEETIHKSFENKKVDVILTLENTLTGKATKQNANDLSSFFSTQEKAISFVTDLAETVIATVQHKLKALK